MTNVTTTGAAQLIPTFLSTIGGASVMCCDARPLHAYLESSYQFADWIKARIDKYGFEQGVDYELASKKSEASYGGQNRTDYTLTLNMGKELAMVETNAKGKEARRYFLDCEKQLHSGMTAAIPVKRQILSRDDLSFTRRKPDGCLDNWFVPPSSPQEEWRAGYAVGQGFFNEIMELARINPKEAQDAIRFTFCSDQPLAFGTGFGNRGRGIECGFVDSLAKASVDGISVDQVNPTITKKISLEYQSNSLIYKRILKDIRKSGPLGLTEFELSRKCADYKAFDHLQKEALHMDIDRFKDARQITFPPISGRGKPRLAWVASEFFIGVDAISSNQ